MAEQVLEVQEVSSETPTYIGKISVLEALAETTTAVSLDQSHQSTQSGQGVDFEDD
jgi:hypothetical protein